MFNLLAQYSPPVYNPSSHGNVTNPGEWAKLADKLGPTMFLAVFCLAALLALIILLGFIFYRLVSKFGPRLFIRLDKFLDDQIGIANKNAESLKNQVGLCQVTRANITCLCEAGHSFADAVSKIGVGVNTDVSTECEEIHRKLKTIVSA